MGRGKGIDLMQAPVKERTPKVLFINQMKGRIDYQKKGEEIGMELTAGHGRETRVNHGAESENGTETEKETETEILTETEAGIVRDTEIETKLQNRKWTGTENETRLEAGAEIENRTGETMNGTERGTETGNGTGIMTERLTEEETATDQEVGIESVDETGTGTGTETEQETEIGTGTAGGTENEKIEARVKKRGKIPEWKQKIRVRKLWKQKLLLKKIHRPNCPRDKRDSKGQYVVGSLILLSSTDNEILKHYNILTLDSFLKLLHGM